MALVSSEGLRPLDSPTRSLAAARSLPSLRRAVLVASFAVLVLAPAARSGERTLFADEFSGTALDRDKWNVIVTGRTVNNEQQAYIDSGDVLSVGDGTLTIRPRFRKGFTTPEGKTFDFVSGRIDTRGKFDFAYGTAAARMKLAAGAGLWPAFWALGNG